VVLVCFFDDRQGLHVGCILSRDFFHASPIGCIAGFKRPVISVRFCSRLFALRQLPNQWATRIPAQDDPSSVQQIIDASSAAFHFIRLPYRMLFAVVTLDTVEIFDTQQVEALVTLAHLHYAPLTDIAWSEDALSLLLTSIDGFCSHISFEPNELGVSYDMSTAERLMASTFTETVINTPLRPRKRKDTKEDPLYKKGTAVANGLNEDDSEKEQDGDMAQRVIRISSETQCASVHESAGHGVLSSSSAVPTVVRKRLSPILVAPLDAALVSTGSAAG
jgi:hypothetical protein